jgi:hypothetical protein
MIMFQAIINTPGYLSNQDELPEFETAAQAWEHLASERQRDLENDMNDDADLVEEDQALIEMDSHAEDGNLGTVYGRTPGYDGDHDLGVAYSVIEVFYASKVRKDDYDNFIGQACCPPIG